MKTNTKITAKDLYHEIINYIKKIHFTLIKNSQTDISEVLLLAERVIGFMAKSKDLNYYAINYYDTNDLYISHSANVAIFSVTMAMGIGYKREELINLCAAAIIHDIGFAKIPEQICEDNIDKLTEKEIISFRDHSKLGYESIIQNSKVSKYIAEIILQHHEKHNGTGFPRELKGEEIHPHARIISIIDIYESLIHPRYRRDIIAPPTGIKQILQKKNDYFSNDMLKSLLKYISIYPVGTFVKLYSNEIGRVIEINSLHPLRPVVKILYDSKGNKIEPFVINLMKESLMTISKCVPVKNNN